MMPQAMKLQLLFLIPPGHPRKKLNSLDQGVGVLHAQKHQRRFVRIHSKTAERIYKLEIFSPLIPEISVLLSEATNNNWEIVILMVFCLFFSIFCILKHSDSSRFDVHTIQNISFTT